jgi:bacterioferritin-associated ferredoxin
MGVDRCICHNITFGQIRELAKENGLSTVEELQEANICSTNCHLCVPYIERMFQTGETEF